MTPPLPLRLIWTTPVGSDVSLARHSVRAAVRTAVPLATEDRLEDLDVVVSELVTNAFVHAHAPIELVVELSGPHAVTVQVRDSGPLLAPQPSARSGPDQLDLAESGRGLLIVEALAGPVVWEIGTDGKRAQVQVTLT